MATLTKKDLLEAIEKFNETTRLQFAVKNPITKMYEMFSTFEIQEHPHGDFTIILGDN